MRSKPPVVVYVISVGGTSCCLIAVTSRVVSISTALFLSNFTVSSEFIGDIESIMRAEV